MKKKSSTNNNQTNQEDSIITIEDLKSAANSEINEDYNEDKISELFILPINKRPFFPGMAAPIIIEPGIYYEMLKAIAKSSKKYIALSLTVQENANINKISFKKLHKIGVLSKIIRIIPMDGGGAQVIVSMEERIKLLSEIKGEFLKAKVQLFIDSKDSSQEMKAYSVSIVSIIKELLKLNPIFKEELQIFLSHSDFTEPGKLADFAVALTTANRDELQDVLNAIDLPQRVEKALILLKQELDLNILQNNINQKIDATISKNQKDYFLREQLKTIKRELGIEKDDKSIDVEKFESRIKKLEVPKNIVPTIKEELEKLQILDPSSAEYSVCRNYLDWLSSVPWGCNSTDNLNIKQAKKTLSQDHYGLEDVKERVLELVGVGKLNKGMKGTILCLVGPPGVGKTSIGKSIAKAIKRKFYRFSVGGMRDEAEIKGHRRTYIGSMPGKIVQALKYCKVMNPVIMIDEIDKMGSGYQGDPAAALLEVLDPEQNKDFLDHYLDVRVDLSNVFFILTANMTDSIPAPLLDRMEVIRLSGYITEEKEEIANKYLIPRIRKESGLTKKDVCFSNTSLNVIINNYAREAGVRSLESSIKKILRKIAFKIVKESEENSKKKRSSFSITHDNLCDYLGKPIFLSDRFYEDTPSGVATGLAWTSHGGATLYIESLMVNSEKTEMNLTGQAGDVMKESSKIAWSYLHSKIDTFAPGKTFFTNSRVHMHIPEGATPKDGPSAGITMVTSLLSLLLEEPISHQLGMTGEITLKGKVLPVGGIREKLVAAKRSGLNEIIFPKANERDFDELPEYLKNGVKTHFVDTYEEVAFIAFPSLKKTKGKKSKAKK